MIAIVVPSDFAQNIRCPAKRWPLQIIGDGSDANTSRLAMGYAASRGKDLFCHHHCQKDAGAGKGKL